MIMIMMTSLILSHPFQMSSQGGIIIHDDPGDHYDHTFDYYDQEDLVDCESYHDPLWF